ncbi:X-Pro dipeptidyl-peptidase domain-containing protein [Neokomagataea thailandica NBRC 106555]|uniref:CocE/NonD family hydrolase n=2 Tax=Neokomagataea TaxID=1223423 RepID=A0A4Y6VAW2_9PROT|nr:MULTISPECIES: CocE/NonD family hydrolase [Neokomagataea]QDH25505.1 CocE/NonD family hydrolase [Neokomagataea tanensis]GBR55069.1 X-Pro dipeptidyl-peptidase domain-containing protein [Neokomagataea thailandica NBRC 106555]
MIKRLPLVRLYLFSTIAYFAIGQGYAQDNRSGGSVIAAVSGYNPEVVHTQPFWSQRIVGYLPTRDNTALRYSVLLPKGKGPFPVVINYSGYDPGGIGSAPYLTGDTAMSVSLDRTLVENGYAVMGVNARGTGCSEGHFTFLTSSYGEDGYDIVEYAAAQHWSDGHIGMANWSWAGMSQIATASTRPPHLSAIAPGMVLADARLDSWAPGGVPNMQFPSGWLLYLQSRWDALTAGALKENDQRCLKQLALNTQANKKFNLRDVLLQHPLRDAEIEKRNLAAKTHMISAPVLSMEAFQDEAVTSREGYYQDTLPAKNIWLVQTNGQHDAYESLKFRKVLINFFDRFLKGDTEKFTDTPHVQVWLESGSHGEGHEKVEQMTPRIVIEGKNYPIVATPKVFTLVEQGNLTMDDKPSVGYDSYAYPVRGPDVDVDADHYSWGALPDQYSHGSLAYTSAPFTQNVIAYGPASANLWVSSDMPDTDLEVTLTELRPDHQEMFVERGWLRLSDREQNTDKSTILRPFPVDQIQSIHSLAPDEPVLGRVELSKMGHVFRTGSRLRIWIDAPGNFGGYGFSPWLLPATNRIWHDSSHVSQFVLGTLPNKGSPDIKISHIPGSLSPCNDVLMQPCRIDPLHQ